VDADAVEKGARLLSVAAAQLAALGVTLETD
jgi:hypothetical protein